MTRFAAAGLPRSVIIASLAIAGIGAASGFVWSSSRPEREPAQVSGTGRITKEQVIAFAGGPPERCVYSRPDRQLCTWKLEGSLVTAGEDAASPAAGGVNLVCELPIDPDADFDGSCTPHARSATAELPPVSAGEPSEAPEGGLPAIPTPELDDAPRLVDLSQRLGAGPDVCRTGVREQTCVWSLSAETAARVLGDAQPTGPLELRCTLPLDGSARAPASCTGTPGS